MKKRMTGLVLAFLLLLGLFGGCGSAPQTSQPVTESFKTLTPGDVGEEGTELVLLVTEAQREADFGQMVWNTIGKFCGEAGIGYASFTVNTEDSGATLATLELAAKGTVKLVVGIGEEMSAIVAEAGPLYPGMQFVLLEGEPELEYSKNTTVVWFEPAQAGWLAGYAAVLGGERALGILHNAQSRHMAFNTGFVLGAAAAAEALALVPGEVAVSVALLPEDETVWDESLAAFFAQKAETVFACGPLLPQVLAAAGENEGGVLGVELDEQPGVLATVRTTPMVAMYSLMQAWQAGKLGAFAPYGLAEDLYTLENYALALEEEALRQLAENAAAWYTGQSAPLFQQLAEGDGDEPLDAADYYAAWRAALPILSLELAEFEEDGSLRLPPVVSNGSGQATLPPASSTTSEPEPAPVDEAPATSQPGPEESGQPQDTSTPDDTSIPEQGGEVPEAPAE